MDESSVENCSPADQPPGASDSADRAYLVPYRWVSIGFLIGSLASWWRDAQDPEAANMPRAVPYAESQISTSCGMKFCILCLISGEMMIWGRMTRRVLGAGVML
ncbi:unnamed protein product [Musa acuminata subsp. burmannicoides]